MHRNTLTDVTLAKLMRLAIEEPEQSSVKFEDAFKENCSGNGGGGGVIPGCPPSVCIPDIHLIFILFINLFLFVCIFIYLPSSLF